MILEHFSTTRRTWALTVYSKALHPPFQVTLTLAAEEGESLKKRILSSSSVSTMASEAEERSVHGDGGRWLES